MEWVKVLIPVKTYPIPSSKYDELVCTAGVREDGSFIRLYPINFRSLPYSRQYEKYQWIEVLACKHKGHDARKESYRPNCDSIKILGKPIPTNRGDWSERAKYALAQASSSMEELNNQQARDRTSLGVFLPKKVHDLILRLIPQNGRRDSRQNLPRNDCGMTARNLPEKCPSSSNTNLNVMTRAASGIA